MNGESEAVDPRWKSVLDQSWKCANCSEEHLGIFDLACAKPDAYSGSEEYKSNAVVVSSTHGLSEDFCILDDQHYFVRCILQLPLIGAPGQYFSYGVWSTLSKKNFTTYAETFDVGEQGSLGPWFGWFSNCLRGYPDTFNLKCQVHPQNGRNRPCLELEPTEHPLTKESREGISFDRLMEIYSLYGHRTAMDQVDKHEHQFPANDWPFSDPINVVAISTRQVVQEGQPVLRVSHDFDGDWQVLCGTTTDVKDAMVVCLGCAFQRNPSIGTLADMPRGWTAWRDSPGDPWTREPKEPEPEEE